jgi:hypothetical protein
MPVAALADGKTEIISVLQPTTAYALAAPSTPASVKAQVLKRLENGEVIDDREIKQLIAQEKEPRQATTKPKKHQTLLAKKMEDAPPSLSGSTDTEVESSIQGVASDPLLRAAIDAVKMLPSDARAAFDEWYRQTYLVLPCQQPCSGDGAPFSEANQSTPALGSAPFEHGMVLPEHPQCASTTPGMTSGPAGCEIESDPLIAEWREFKPNSQNAGRHWVVNGAPEATPPNEHHIITNRLQPWRLAYLAATPERQEAIRLCFAQQP